MERNQGKETLGWVCLCEETGFELPSESGEKWREVAKRTSSGNGLKKTGLNPILGGY